MKQSIPFLFVLMLLLCWNVSNAQVFKKIKDEIRNRTENKIVNKAGTATDKAIDKATNGVKKQNRDDVAQSDGDSHPATEPTSSIENKLQDSTAIYKNYDFVPGDKIIFQPDMSNESDAELPARFTVEKGNAEIQTLDHEKILRLQGDGNTTVAPLMNSDNYLPNQFTLEFDMMYENDPVSYKYGNDISVNFRKKDDKNYSGYPFFHFTIGGASTAVFGDQNPVRTNFPTDLATSASTKNTWHHIAIYVRNNLGKVYIDQYRVIATNKLPLGAGKVDINAGRDGIKIKNVRLAAGGNDKYNEVITAGKFITHGILFDVNKSTIRPESMGTLNEIAKLMKDHSDLKFEIDGHTDSDGSADANIKLSQQRADAVKAKLIELGVEASRLTTSGFGESKPIGTNDTSEGKANNRRVEFVKK